MSEDKSKPEETVEEVKEETSEAELPKEEKQEKATAKAGKRSAKAVKEAEEKAEKEERKANPEEVETTSDAPADVKKGPKPVTKPKIERRSKRYQDAVKNVKTDETYDLKSGVTAALKSSTVKFDASVELHVRLGVDPKQADQNIRSHIVLPHGIGKEARVAVFAPAEMHAAAKKAGADIVGEESIVEMLKKEQLDFDILIATPQLMSQLGKFAKVLGPKGLMPNPKSGTVTKDVDKAITEAKAGRVEYRVDSEGIIHQNIGKVSFGDAKVLENAEALIASIKTVRPASIKGNYVESAFLTTSMGPSVRVNIQ